MSVRTLQAAVEASLMLLMQQTGYSFTSLPLCTRQYAKMGIDPRSGYLHREL